MKSLDTTVAQISLFYHDELINLLSDGSIDGRRSSSTRDQSLYALVHSFFLHLGAARDYLATFIAAELNMDTAKTDSMARLVDALRGPKTSGSAILQILEAKGDVEPIGTPSTKWEVAGWLKEASDLRNEFTHRRTYGHTLQEQMGRLQAIETNVGLYRYFRPISWGVGTDDVFDTILSHYEKLNERFFAAAEASGFDTSIIHLTENDIVSVSRSV